LEKRAQPLPHFKRRVSAALAAAIALTATLQSGCRAEQQPWPLWEAYAQHFIDGQGRVVDHTAGDRTTSEGQAYALFFALVDNDQARFAKILSWTEANLAGGDLTLHLPAWSWGKKTADQWTVLDQNPASDADLWLAYDLLEAGRLWRNPRYSNLGQTIAARIAQQEVVSVPTYGITLIAGPSGFHPTPDTWIVNPSYLPLPILAYLSQTVPQAPWGEVRKTYPALVTGGTPSGFAMDWVSLSGQGLRPVPAPVVSQTAGLESVAAGSYDAIRVYLWAGISHPDTPGAQYLYKQLGGMTDYMKGGALTPPLAVDMTGKVVVADSPPGFSAALIPFLQSQGLKAQAKVQADRLAGTLNTSTGLYGQSQAYYDQNLALFATGWSEKRYRFDQNGKLHPVWDK
jgi:endoglucanase